MSSKAKIATIKEMYQIDTPMGHENDIKLYQHINSQNYINFPTVHRLITAVLFNVWFEDLSQLINLHV